MNGADTVGGAFIDKATQNLGTILLFVVIQHGNRPSMAIKIFFLFSNTKCNECSHRY